MTRAAETTPTIDDDRVDQAFRLLEAAWVAAEFDEIIAASWPTDPVAREDVLRAAIEGRTDAEGPLDADRLKLWLEDARNESAVLTKRRDEIAAELEGLSGVIQALAVPTDGPADGPAESAPKEKETHP